MYLLCAQSEGNLSLFTSGLRNADLLTREWSPDPWSPFPSLLVSFFLHSSKGDGGGGGGRGGLGIYPPSCYCEIIIKIRSADTCWVHMVTNWDSTSFCFFTREAVRKPRDREDGFSHSSGGGPVFVFLRSRHPKGKTSARGLVCHFLGGRSRASSRWESQSWGGTLSTSWRVGGNNGSLITPWRSKHVIRILLVELEVFLLWSGLRKRNGNGVTGFRASMWRQEYHEIRSLCCPEKHEEAWFLSD